MKKVFYWILFVSLFFITGCSTEYSIELKDNSFSERVIITVPNYINDSRINDLIENNMYPKIDNELVLYNKEIINGIDNNKLIFSYTYNDNDFNESILMNQCFDQFSYIKQDNYYSINVTGNFYCLEQNNKVIIKISTDGDVITSNANRRSKGTYIWEIDGSNVNNVSIIFQVSRPINEKNNNIFFVFKSICLLVILFLLGYVLYRKCLLYSKKPH